VEAKDRLIDELRKANRELLQHAHFHERHIKELRDELLQTYRNLQDRSCSLDKTRTWLQQSHDEVQSTRHNAHYLEVELEQRGASSWSKVRLRLRS
jgi:DNA-binding transcriptional regulator GbsR (MarR family)